MKITFIGGGNMGEAVLAAVLEKGLTEPAGIIVSDISRERREYLEKQYGIMVYSGNGEAVAGRDIIVLAVKPQNINDIFHDLKGSLQPGQLVLSIIAGIEMGTISRGLGHSRIVRAMPNTPARVGRGMSGWTATAGVSGKQREWVRSILGAMGKEVYFEDEKYLDMVTAVSGSGPAYFFRFAECLVDAAVDIGLSREEAEEMVKQTLRGAAQLMEESGEPPAELRRKVTSKGGTTEKAINVFEEGEIADLVKKAVRAAYQRAREMGS
jgi:pyrroline-5-carboxylate reductase